MMTINEEKFYEVCKILIATDTFNKDKAPYVLGTAIDSYTQNKFGSVEFDYKKVFEREDKYKDVVGFYHTHPPGCFGMSSTDTDTMTQWVKCFGKSLICLIECEGIVNAWLFVKGEDGSVSILDVKANTTNNVNYYVWTDPTPSFWDNADFLVKGEAYYEEGDQEDPFAEIIERLENLEAGFTAALSGLENLTSAVEDLTNIIAGEEDEQTRD